MNQWLILALACCALLPACTSEQGGEMRLSALGARRLVLERPLREGVYADLDSEHGFWFSDIELDGFASAAAPIESAVVVHAQLVWKPEPGRTPLSATATNTVIRVMVVSKGEVGIYGGAGFARPTGNLEDDVLEMDLKGGTLTLLHATKGFHDLLSPAELTGVLKARRSTDDVQRWRRASSQFATNALGKSMWVSSDGAPATEPTEAAALAFNLR
jgi:hypothetical protein